MDVMTPYYEGFKGKIEVFDDYFISSGILEITRNEGIVKEIHIKELPIGEYIDSFEKFLYDKFHSSVQGFIHKIENYSGNNTPDIIIHCNTQLSDEEIHDKLNMSKKYSLKNMVLHDKNGKLCKFKDANSIIIEHSLVRFDFYEKRIEWKKENISKLLKEKSEQKRFIENVINESIDIKQKTEIVEEKLVELDFVKIQDKFSYLLGMKIQSLNEDKIEDLDKQIEKLRSELHDISNTTVIDLWNSDLDILEQEVDKYLNNLKENRNFEKKRKQTGSVQATKKNKK
jgi:DNA topoisomerase-2